jgi:hypothetical protein
MGNWKRLSKKRPKVMGNQLPKGSITSSNVVADLRLAGGVSAQTGVAVNGARIINSAGEWVAPNIAGLKGAKGAPGAEYSVPEVNSLPATDLPANEGSAVFVPEYGRMALNTGSGFALLPPAEPLEGTFVRVTPSFGVLVEGQSITLEFGSNFEGVECRVQVDGVAVNVATVGKRHSCTLNVASGSQGAPSYTATFMDVVGRSHVLSGTLAGLYFDVETPTLTAETRVATVLPGETIAVEINATSPVLWGDAEARIGTERAHVVPLSGVRCVVTAVAPLGSGGTSSVSYSVDKVKTRGLRRLPELSGVTGVSISQGPYVQNTGPRPEVFLRFAAPDTVIADFTRDLSYASESFTITGGSVDEVSSTPSRASFKVSGTGRCSVRLPPNAAVDAGGNGNPEAFLEFDFPRSTQGASAASPVEPAPFTPTFYDGNAYTIRQGPCVSFWARERPVPISLDKTLLSSPSDPLLRYIGSTGYEFCGTQTAVIADGNYHHHCVAPGHYWIDGEAVAAGGDAHDTLVFGNTNDPLSEVYQGFRGDVCGLSSGLLRGPHVYRNQIFMIGDKGVRGKLTFRDPEDKAILLKVVLEAEGNILLSAGVQAKYEEGRIAVSSVGGQTTYIPASPGEHRLGIETGEEFAIRVDGGARRAMPVPVRDLWVPEGLAKNACLVYSLPFPETCYQNFEASSAPTSPGLAEFMTPSGVMRAVDDLDAAEAYGADRIVASYQGPLWRSGDALAFPDPRTGMYSVPPDVGEPEIFFDQAGSSRVLPGDIWRPDSRMRVSGADVRLGFASGASTVYPGPCDVVTGTAGATYLGSSADSEICFHDAKSMRVVNTTTDTRVAIFRRA